MSKATVITESRTTAPIPWWSPQTTGLEEAFIREVLESNYLNEGSVTERFEHTIAELLGAKHAVATTSGTAALFLALAGIGVGPGDEVIVPDVTFIATANAVSLTGAKPVLVDIDPKNLTLDPKAVAAAITPRTKAIIPVHVSGRAGHVREIAELACERGLHLIEDAAEALCSKLNDECLGTVGRAGCFSFSPNKTITTGQGGVIVTNDDVLHMRLRELKDQGRPVRGTGGDDLHRSVGYNFKFTNLQAAVGLGQLTELPARLQRQRSIFQIYRGELNGLPGLTFPGFDLEAGETPQWTDVLVERRDALDRFLAQRGIHCRRFWFPVHTQTPYRRPDAEFPNSTRVIPHALWLPSAFTLSDEDVRMVCAHIQEFFDT